MRHGAPIRFLILLVGGWTCMRLVAWSPTWSSPDPLPTGPPEHPAAARPTAVASSSTGPAISEVVRPTQAGAQVSRLGREGGSPALPSSALLPLVLSAAPAPAALRATSDPAGSRPVAAVRPTAQADRSPTEPPPNPALPPPAHPAGLRPTPAVVPSRRLSGSAWLLLRRDGAPGLAPGGTLGGSQAGGRLLYRLDGGHRRGLALSARAYAPLRRSAGAEAAFGLDWRPVPGLPVHLLLERRQRLGREGRSAFGATVYGGGSAALGGGWRLDGYAQAGVVGARSRDPFVDGSARVSRPFGPLEIGGAIWGAAQPGASRLDAGPQLALPFRAGASSLRLSAEYRFRLAGDARPASGPALTLGVDF